jgi:decaprenyl-phosphate phosphoribosyltransferase
MLYALWWSVRPKQWVKNLLLLAAPMAAGVPFVEYRKVALGILCFTLSSILGYLLNDWLDRGRDSLHETKKNRPFASGRLGLLHLTLIFVPGLILLTYLSLLLNREFRFAVFIYLLITFSYSIKVKTIPVLELIWLSSGFLIRAIAGSAIIELPPSGWFIVSVLFGSLTIVSMKRMAEKKNLNSAATRKVLTNYSEEYLRMVWTVSIGITVLTYALWIYEIHGESVPAQASIVIFTLSVLLYAQSIDSKDAEEPETLVLKSPLLVMCVLLNISILIGVFYN